MPQEPSLPAVVIVGRPNVGKSTLFNAILGKRRSIVGDEPGITRDRIHGEASHQGRRFELIDTGGIIPNDAEMIPSQILKQARVAIDHAKHIIFLIDGRTEITGSDRELAQMLQKLGKPVTVAVNKIDAPQREALAHEFYSLGFRDLFPVSSEHQLGIGDLLDHVCSGFPAAEQDEVSEQRRTIKVAIIGRPNVGKSTLLNALVGQERSIVSPVAGTTRDAVDERVTRDGADYVFVDTAGIRRKGKTKLMAEKLSVVMARRHIDMAHVVLILLDAPEGLVGLDATIAGYAHEAGRGVILVVNKWDAAADPNRGAFSKTVRESFKFLAHAPIVFISAKTGAGVDRLFSLAAEVYDSCSLRVPTGELNRFAESLELEPDTKVKYLTQVSVRPPTFVLFTDHRGPLHFSAERNLVNRLRRQFGFLGAPIVVKTKESRRPARRGRR